MIDWIILGGLAYLLIKDKDNDTEEENLPDPGGVPIPDDTDGGSDGPEVQEYTKISSWSGEAFTTGPGGDNVVWIYHAGIRYTDGTTVMDDSQYIVIGDASHHNFLRQNTSGGSINIPKEMTGGSTDQNNVTVFASIEQAIARAEESSNPEEDDDPMGPQKQPEDDDSTPTQPSLPTQPSGGLGGGTQWTGAYMGGGM